MKSEKCALFLNFAKHLHLTVEVVRRFDITKGQILREEVKTQAGEVSPNSLQLQYQSPCFSTF